MRVFYLLGVRFVSGYGTAILYRGRRSRGHSRSGRRDSRHRHNRARHSHSSGRSAHNGDDSSHPTDRNCVPNNDCAAISGPRASFSSCGRQGRYWCPRQPEFLPDLQAWLGSSPPAMQRRYSGNGSSYEQCLNALHDKALLSKDLKQFPWILDGNALGPIKGPVETRNIS